MVSETTFYWCRFQEPTYTSWDVRGNKFKDDYRCSERHLEYLPAPSSEELLEVMPDWSDANDMMGIIVFRDCGIYFVQLKRYLSDAYKVDFNSESLSEALGKMCLWLLENGYHYDKEKGGLVR
ncbi:MAG: hypothetical protein WC554_16675 [Clostridia bacterium]